MPEASSSTCLPPHCRPDVSHEITVAAVQRRRVIDATYEVAARGGVGSLTTQRVVDRAGVSRRTFYELFASCEDCLLITFEDAIAAMHSQLACACADRSRWREKMRAGVEALLGLFDARPDLGILLVVESLSAGPSVLQARRRALAPLIAAVDQGREVAARSAAVSGLTAEAAVGAVAFILHSRMLEHPQARIGPRPPLAPLAGELTSIVLLPYLGAAAARLELERSMAGERGAPAAAEVPAQRRDPHVLKQLDMRLTHRTMRVLAVIAERPGASNRDVGAAAGARDQGQTSKLLARLQGLGLIENRRSGRSRGGPNAWHLTDLGEQLHHAIAVRGRLLG